MTELIEELENCAFDVQSLDEMVRRRAADAGLGAGKLIHPLRLALTGGTQSPGLFEMMVVLGRETCLRRIRRALDAISPVV
jgi:glutamyl-tRNA synthetase